MRTKIAKLGIIFIFLFLFFSLFSFTVIRSKFFKALSNRNSLRVLAQPACRGRILDAEGNIIVDNQLCYDVLLMPNQTEQPDKTLEGVAQILGISLKKLKETFKKNYVAPFAPTLVAEDIEPKKAIFLEELKWSLGGLIIQARPKRRYHYSRLACHLLGYLGEIDRWRLTKLADYGYKTKDTVGFGGIEERYDYYLRQEEGGMQVEVDNKNNFMRVLGFKPPQKGKDIQLTINLKIQKIVEENLKGKIGSVILMEPESGQILALASYPNFNPALFLEKQTVSILKLFNNPEAPLLNRAIAGLYPAASVFKLIVATAGLETAKISFATTFFCPGKIHIGKREFSCWTTHGQQDLGQAISHSCDIFFYRTGLLLGGQLLHHYALKFGLAKPTSIDLPYEASGFVPSPFWKRIYRFQNWFAGDTANLAIGQGELLVSPIQLTRMMAVFANGGRLVNPYVVKAIDGGDISSAQKKTHPLALKKSTLDFIRQGLRNAVAQESGTANVLSDLPVAVAGKTGTAQVLRGQPHSWFVGFSPFDRPKFVLCIFLEHGGSGHMACLLAKQIIEAMLKAGLL